MTTANTFTQPSNNLNVQTEILRADSIHFRVHPHRFGPVQFNDSGAGNARFSPIYDSNGKIIPTIYSAQSLEAALMETVFHDVPTSTNLKSYDKTKFYGIAHSSIKNTQDLKLAKLYGPGMRGLGILEGELIHSSAADYLEVRKWAVAIHTQMKDVQGLIWVSKQCSPHHAYLFFGDRISSSTLDTVQAYPDLNDSSCQKTITDLAKAMNVNLL